MDFVTDASFGIIPLKEEEGKWYVLLILHQGGRHWAFPKGHGDPGEEPLDSARRELKEETGLEVDRVLKEDPFTEVYQFYRKREKVRKTVKYFPAVVRGALQLQQEEIRAAKWVPLKEAYKHVTFKEAREMCQAILEFLRV